MCILVLEGVYICPAYCYSVVPTENKLSASQASTERMEGMDGMLQSSL
jgi:hypothetical protein